MAGHLARIAAMFTPEAAGSATRNPRTAMIRARSTVVAYFARDTISIILPSSSSGAWAFARS
jgi:hypothetical protein